MTVENRSIFLEARNNVGEKEDQEVTQPEVLCQPGLLSSEVCSPAPVPNLILFSYEPVNARDEKCPCDSQKRYLMPVLHRYNMNLFFGVRNVKVKLKMSQETHSQKLGFHTCAWTYPEP